METVDLCSSSEKSYPNSPLENSNHNSHDKSYSLNHDFDGMDYQPVNNFDEDSNKSEFDEEGDRFILPIRKSCSVFTSSLSDMSPLSISDKKIDDECNPSENIESEFRYEDLNTFDISNNSSDEHAISFKTKKSTGRKNNKTVTKHDSTEKNEKELKKIEKQKVKDLKNKEKALKKAETQNQRCLKPGECLKYIIAEISPFILHKDFSSSILEILQNNGVNFVKEGPPIAPDNVIGWIRKYPKYSVNVDGEMSVETQSVREPFLLILYDMSDIEHLLITRMLNQEIKHIKAASCCQVTMILYGVKNFFRNKKVGVQKKKENVSKISENDLDYYLTKLLFEESTSCFKVNSPEELAQTIFQFTKSIAETPFKKQKQSTDEKADFFMRGDNKKCVKVDTAGNGLSQLWCQSLTKFPLISLEKAHAICEKFTSPVNLITEFQRSSVQDGIKMLANISVTRATGSCSSSRCIGPETARKIHTYFMSQNGDTNLI